MKSAGYRCTNLARRTILTLDIHHMVYVSEGGGNATENLLALFPNCHAESAFYEQFTPSRFVRTPRVVRGGE